MTLRDAVEDWPVAEIGDGLSELERLGMLPLALIQMDAQDSAQPGLSSRFVRRAIVEAIEHGSDPWAVLRVTQWALLRRVDGLDAPPLDTLLAALRPGRREQ
jgi:hypothetical protein